MFPVGTLALFSYLVSITWSELGIGIHISYIKEVMMERFSDLAEVTSDIKIQTVFSVGHTFFTLTFSVLGWKIL